MYFVSQISNMDNMASVLVEKCICIINYLEDIKQSNPISYAKMKKSEYATLKRNMIFLTYFSDKVSEPQSMQKISDFCNKERIF